MLKKITTLFLAIALVYSAHSQTVLLSEDFDGGLGDWVAESNSCSGGSNQNALWTHASSGAVTDGAYSGDEGYVIDSKTPDNGVAVFNSDFLDNGGVAGAFGQGSCPSPHSGSLVSPSIDCSGQSEVFVYFYQFHVKYADINGELGPLTFVEVSGDGGSSWTSFEINPFVSQNSFNYSEDESQSLDISEVAAGKSNVKVRFRFAGDYYVWIIDDVAITGGRADKDLAILDSYYPLDSYATPSSQIDRDTMHFLCKVGNNGQAISNVTVEARVAQLNDDVEFVQDVFTVTKTISTLAAGEIEEVYFDDVFVPELDLGNYAVIYNVYAGTENDEVYSPHDNSVERRFVVNGDQFNKFRGFNTTYFNSTSGTYMMANVIEMNPDYLEPLLITEVSGKGFFRASYTGPVNSYVIEATDAVNKEFSNITLDEKYTAPADAGANTTLIGRGIGSKQVRNTQSSYNELTYTVDIKDIENPDVSGTMVNPGSRYLVGVEYESKNEGHEFSDYANYGYNISTNNGNFNLADYPFASFDDVTWIWNSGTWSPVYFDDAVDVPTYSANIGITLSIGTAIDEIPLPEASVSVSPNPSTDFVNVSLELETPQTINIFLADVTGKIIKQSVQKKFTSGIIEFSTSDLPSGTYLVRVITEEGTKTKKIVVL